MTTIIGVWTLREPGGEVNQVRMLNDGRGHYLLQADDSGPLIRSSELTEVIRHLASRFAELQTRGGSVTFEEGLTTDPDAVMITMTEAMVAHAITTWLRAADGGEPSPAS